MTWHNHFSDCVNLSTINLGHSVLLVQCMISYLLIYLFHLIYSIALYLITLLFLFSLNAEVAHIKSDQSPPLSLFFILNKSYSFSPTRPVGSESEREHSLYYQNKSLHYSNHYFTALLHRSTDLTRSSLHISSPFLEHDKSDHGKNRAM